MGEARRKALAARQGGVDNATAQVVDTLGGRMHVRWDEGAAATPHGQLVSRVTEFSPVVVIQISPPG